MPLRFLLLCLPLSAQPAPEPILKNWPASQQFQLPPEPAKGNGTRDAISASPLSLVAMQPCRILDTRAAAPANQRLVSGPLAANTAVTVPILSSPCGLPASAAAYSLNITVDTGSTGPLTFLSAWPTGSQPVPLTSTLNAPGGGIVANAAVVAAGTGGAIDLYASNATQVIIDVNGYYAVTPGQGPVAVYRTPPAPNPALVLCIAQVRSINLDFSIREIDTADAVTTGPNWVFTTPVAGLYFITSTVDQPMDTISLTLQIDPPAGSLAPTQLLRTVSKGAGGGPLGPPLAISTVANLRAGDRVRLSTLTGGCVGSGWVSIHSIRPQ